MSALPNKRPDYKNKWQVLYVPAILILAFFVLSTLLRCNSGQVQKTYLPNQQIDSFKTTNTSLSLKDSIPQPPGFMLPAITSGDAIVKHFAFTLSYSEADEQAKWVAYTLTGEMARATGKRQGSFRPDPAVITGSSRPEDYKKSGYDRGHLVPSADMKWSDKAQSECFLLSNISPQNHEFNAGIWAGLEMNVRKWAKVNNRIYIVTGPILEKGLKKIGKDGVSVPNYFYKIVLDVEEPEIKEIAFIIPNLDTKEDLWKFACKVSDVEKRTGIDFFSALPDSLEHALENTLDIVPWKNTAIKKRQQIKY